MAPAQLVAPVSVIDVSMVMVAQKNAVVLDSVQMGSVNAMHAT